MHTHTHTHTPHTHTQKERGRERERERERERYIEGCGGIDPQGLPECNNREGSIKEYLNLQ
jgi:hypothetical protein